MLMTTEKSTTDDAIIVAEIFHHPQGKNIIINPDFQELFSLDSYGNTITSILKNTHRHLINNTVPIKYRGVYSLGTEYTVITIMIQNNGTFIITTKSAKECNKNWIEQELLYTISTF